MKMEIEILLNIQDKDLKIREIERKQKEEPERIEVMKTRYEEKVAELKNAQDNKKGLIVKKETLETEIESIRDKINKCQLQLYQLKTNTEYRTMEKEIEDLKKKKIDREDDVLELMESIEYAVQEIKEKEKEVKAKENELNQEKAMVEEELKRLEQEKVNLKQEKEAEAEKIDKKIYSIYQRTFRNKNGIAVVPVEKNICGGCHMNLPPNVMNDVMKINQKIITCESCSRILYYNG